MHFEKLLLPPSLFWLTGLISVLTVLIAVRHAPWRALLAVQARQHLFLGSILFLNLIWFMHIQWAHSLSVHLLGMTALTVIFGWSLAVVAGTLALAAHIALTHGLWVMMPLELVVAVLLPIGVTWLVSQLIARLASRNLYLFMLGTGFIGAILSLWATVAAVLALVLVFDHADLWQRLSNEFGILALLSYAEGFMNGMIVAATTIFAPDLVKTFDSRRYIGS